MNTIIIIALIVLAVGVVLLLFAKRQAKQHGTNTAEEFAGICMFALDQTIRKQRNKNRIVELLRERGELSNHEIRKTLKVSRQSVVNYLDELEAEGRAQQIGDAGRGVTYRPTTP